MRVLFMGSSEFSVPSLEALLASSHDVVAVYTKSPKPAGRGRFLTKTPVHVCADKYGVPVRNPVSLTSIEDEREVILEYAPNVVAVVAYGLILPKWMLACRFKCVNVHPSLLPRWRGAAPMQHTILSGDTITGVTILTVGELLDAGEIFLQESTPVGATENIEELSRRLSKMGSEMLLRVVDNIDDMSPSAQSDIGVTYAKKPENFRIDFNCTADYVCRQIRALYPGVFFLLNEKRIRVLEAKSYPSSGEACVGAVINDKLHVQCANNTVLVPKVVQQESKRPCDVESFLRGFRGGIPTVLS